MAKTLEEAFKTQEELWKRIEKNNEDLPNIRFASLNDDYELKVDTDYGSGYFPVHKETGECCECKMQWNKDGTVLLCTNCFYDGT